MKPPDDLSDSVPVRIIGDDDVSDRVEFLNMDELYDFIILLLAATQF